MSPETAKHAIARVLELEDEFREVIIEFIGGEVMVRWPLVQEVIDWSLDNRARWKKAFSFFIDTNGTLLNDEKKAWIRARQPHLGLGLSLDGTPYAHNVNRSNSYDRIAPHLDFFAEMWPHQTVKMTISPATIPYVFDGVIHIMRHGLKVAANFPLEDIWGPPNEKQRHVDAFRAQIEQLVAFFGLHDELPLPSLINLPVQILFSDERNRPWCGSGRSMLAIDTDGTVLPCNRYARMSFDQALFEAPVQQTTSVCDSCFFRASCQTCEAHNWEVTGSPNCRTSFHCEFVKLQIWGTAQVRAIRFSRMIKQLEKRLRCKPPSDREMIDTVTDHFRFVRDHLVGLETLLHLFEEAESLEAVGAGFYANDPFVPPAGPAWTLPSLQPAITADPAAR